MFLASLHEKTFADTLLAVSRRTPLAVSLAFSLIYVGFCSLYIWYSSRIAAQFAPSVHDLEQIELTKGLLFVLASGGLIFILAFLLLRKVAQMNARLIAQHEGLVATERIATAGLLATSTCHDINNIMAAVQGNLEMLLLTSPLNDEGRKCVGDALHACRKLNQMTTRLLAIGHEKLPGAISETDLCQVVRETVDFAAHHQRLRHCALNAELPAALPWRANPSLVSRMLLNLLLNAADAAGEKGRIEVRLLEQPDTTVIEVHDNGPGIPPEQREHIFEPFYTTKAAGNGLGLLSVKACASEHQGTVEVTASDLGGACFRVTFPRQPGGAM